ncbi:MAG: sugar transferase [Oscillospiraceae bacterium]|nr:sugar transferase [Oscillospiraceae bacterium]
MIILKIILVIIVIAAAVGVIATVADLLGKRNGSHKPFGPYERFVKRGLDAFLATGALIVLSPVLLITAIMVRVKLGSPVLFTQDRPGKDEKIFKLYKFRSMTDDRDENGQLLPNEVRLTPFGRKLRSTSLDELPELINIAKGDMSIIGPRPLLIRYLPAYTETERHRHDVRPGLSGLAQVNGRNFVKWDQRLAFDVEYVNKITFLGDVKIILKTIEKVFKHDDIAENPDDIDEGFLDEIRGVTASK